MTKSLGGREGGRGRETETDRSTERERDKGQRPDDQRNGVPFSAEGNKFFLSQKCPYQL